MKISIVIPCHDAEPYLAQTLGAALDQSRPVHEILVVDDGSTDGSLEVAQTFEERMPDVIRVVTAQFGRATRARNLGADLVSGDAIMFLDADDVLRRDALEALSAALSRDAAGIAVCPWFRLGYVEGRWMKQRASCAPRSAGQDALSAWLTGWYHPPCSVLWSRAAFQRAGRWDDEALVNQDGDLMMRALAYGMPLLETPEGAAYYRRPAGGRTSLSGTRSKPDGLASRVRTIRKIAWILEDLDRLTPYRAAIGAALRRVAADAQDVPAIREEALALARQFRPALWTRLGRRARRLGAVRRAAEPPPDPPEEVRSGMDRAEQVLRSAAVRRDGADTRHRAPRHPAVSVVVPTYNRAPLLLRAIASVRSQTFGDFEILIVDDGSTDGTAQAVEALQDSRIRYLRQPRNAGVSAARNRGLREARGDLIAFLDSDDEWFPQKLAHQVARFRELPQGVGLLYGGVENQDGRGGRRIKTPHHRGNLYRELLVENVIHGTSGVMIRRSVVASAGFFDEGIPAIEDYDYWLRMARFFDADCIEEPLIRYHEPPDVERKSLNVRDNQDAREWLYRKHARRMREAGVAHLFLLTSARKALSGDRADVRAARRLAIRAVLEKPESRTALAMLLRTLVQRSPARTAGKPRTMRVLLYSCVQPADRGGVQAVIARIARHLRGRGHGVVKAWAAGGPGSGDITYRPPHLVWKGRVPTLRSMAGACLDVLRLARGLARQRPHIVNVHFVTRETLWFLLLRPLFGYKVVVSVHGSDVLRPKPGHAAAVPGVLRSADAVTVVSKATAAYVLGAGGVDPHRVHLIPNGVDCSFWAAPESARALADRPPIILAVGRLHPVKGHDLLVRALPKAIARVPGLRLVIVGAGGFRTELERIVESLGLRAAVEFAGELAPDALRERMTQARVFVLPSRSEGLPLTLLEAMAGGLPVIAARVGGVPEVLVPGTGILIPPEDTDGLAEALSDLLLRPEAAGLMAARAIARARQFSGAAADAAYEDVFQELVDPASLATRSSVQGGSAHRRLHVESGGRPLPSS